MIPDLLYLALTLLAFAGMAWLAQVVDRLTDSEDGR